MTAPCREAPVTGAAVASSTKALATRARKRREFLWGVAVQVSERAPGTNEDARDARMPESVEGRGHEIASDPPVHGYLHWCLLDNLEGTAGHDTRFSLVAVDHTTLVRTNKLRLNGHESVVGDTPPGHRWT